MECCYTLPTIRIPYQKTNLPKGRRGRNYQNFTIIVYYMIQHCAGGLTIKIDEKDTAISFKSGWTNTALPSVPHKINQSGFCHCNGPDQAPVTA